MTSVFIISIRLIIVQIVAWILLVTLGTVIAGRHLLRCHREPASDGGTPAAITWPSSAAIEYPGASLGARPGATLASAPFPDGQATKGQQSSPAGHSASVAHVAASPSGHSVLAALPGGRV